MLMRNSITNPTSMYTSVYYNEAKYCGKTGYFNGRYKNGYQCVNYAVSRACEIAKRAVCYYSGISTKDDIEKPMFKRFGYGNAIDWLNDTLWGKGNEPKVGAIMVYGSSYGNGYGHVRVVEAIDGDIITYSGANESNLMAFKTLKKPTISKTGFLGYIYNPFVDVEDKNLIVIKKEDNYDYKWTVDGNRYGDTYDITTQNGFGDTNLINEGWEQLLKVNASLFYSWNDNGKVKHFACGLEKSRGVNNQELEMDCVKDYNSCMAIACVNDELYFASQEWIIKNKLNEAYGAVTGLGLILGGKARNDMHKGFETQWNQLAGRTIIGEDKDGNFMSYSIEGDDNKGGLTASQAQSKCLELGFYNAIMLDGGSSVFREFEGKYDISTGRKVKNALILYRKKKTESTEEPKTDEDYKSKYLALEEDYKALASENAELNKQLEQVKTSLEQAQKERDSALSDFEAINDKLKKVKELLG